MGAGAGRGLFLVRQLWKQIRQEGQEGRVPHSVLSLVPQSFNPLGSQFSHLTTKFHVCWLFKSSCYLSSASKLGSLAPHGFKPIQTHCTSCAFMCGLLHIRLFSCVLRAEAT